MKYGAMWYVNAVYFT